MSKYDDKLWRETFEKTLSKYDGDIATFDFWVEVKQLTTWDGGTRDEIFPRISISFK